MTINPILPITIITLITIILLLYIIIFNKKDILEIIIVLLLFIINLKPTITNKDYKDYDLLFILDTTYSMNIKDINTKRIDQAKEDIKYIIENINHKNISLITFDNKTNIIIPSTNDNFYINKTINSINTIEKEYATGTSIYSSLDEVNKYLKKEKNKIIMFYLSDGENTKEVTKYNYSSIKENIIDGIIIGYGTKKGNYIDNKNISKIDEKCLKEISKKLNINYIHTSNKSEIKRKINMINRKNKSYIELYQILIIILMLLLTIEINKYRRFI